MDDRRHDARNQARWGYLPSRQEPLYAETARKVVSGGARAWARPLPDSNRNCGRAQRGGRNLLATSRMTTLGGNSPAKIRCLSVPLALSATGSSRLKCAKESYTTSEADPRFVRTLG